MARVPTARSVAVDVLVRVDVDRAFASAALDAELARNVQLEARDRGLATELVYGTLRHAQWLEPRIMKYARKGKLEPRIRAILLVSAYQILVLTRVPAFAAVNEAVTLAGDAHVGGFVNAVLRKIAKELKPSPEEIAEGALASLPLGASIIRSIGREAALDLLGSADAPPIGLRVEDASTRDEWIEKLRAAKPNATFGPGKRSPLAILAYGAGRITDLPGYEEGAWTPQEEGSQVVALTLGARPTDRVLDACAGRGNKTGLLLGTGATVDAADLHPKKLDRLRIELHRIHFQPNETFAVDWSGGKGDLEGPYDRILVDAPCSGTGTLRRRPEIGLRREESDLTSLTRLQKQILTQTAALLKPGGKLVYAVCSVLREEGEDVIDIASSLGLVREESFRLLPGTDGTDGYFIAVFSLPPRP